MKVNAKGLFREVAATVDRAEGVHAYLLREFYDNLREVVLGRATLEEFRAVYVGWDADPFLVDCLGAAAPLAPETGAER